MAGGRQRADWTRAAALAAAFGGDAKPLAAGLRQFAPERPRPTNPVLVEDESKSGWALFRTGLKRV